MVEERTIKPDVDEYACNQKAVSATYFFFMIADIVIAVWSVLLHLTYQTIFSSIYFFICLIILFVHAAAWVMAKKRTDYLECSLSLRMESRINELGDAVMDSGTISGVIKSFGRYQKVNIRLDEVDHIAEMEEPGFILYLKEDREASTVIEQNTKSRNSRLVVVRGEGYALSEFRDFYNGLCELIPAPVSSGGRFWKVKSGASVWDYLLLAQSILPGVVILLLTYL